MIYKGCLNKGSSKSTIFEVNSAEYSEDSKHKEEYMFTVTNISHGDGGRTEKSVSPTSSVNCCAGKVKVKKKREFRFRKSESASSGYYSQFRKKPES